MKITGDGFMLTIWALLSVGVLSLLVDVFGTVEKNPYPAAVVSQYLDPHEPPTSPYKLIVVADGKQHTVACTAHQFYTLKPSNAVTVVEEKSWLYGITRSRKVKETP